MRRDGRREGGDEQRRLSLVPHAFIRRRHVYSRLLIGGGRDGVDVYLEFLLAAGNHRGCIFGRFLLVQVGGARSVLVWRLIAGLTTRRGPDAATSGACSTSEAPWHALRLFGSSRT